MTSISSMPYAVRKNDSNWIKDTAEDIKKLRLKHGDTHPYYELIKDSFYCYGCYKKWIKENHTEPFDYALPKLTHYIYENGNKTHFKLRRKSQEKNHDHLKGCYFNDPSDYYKELSDSFDHIKIAEKQTARLIILNRMNQILKTEIRSSTKGLGKTIKPKASHLQTFGALQDIYNRYGESWRELPVITEDNETKKIENLLLSPDEAIDSSKQYPNKIAIVYGTIQRVEARNNGGYINIVFKQGSNKSDHPFRLSVSPYHIYNETDLQCLENRKIGCYGRLKHNQGFSQIELFSLHHQIVFLDLQKSEPCPFRTPSINIDRIQKLLTRTMEFHHSKLHSYHPEMFTFHRQAQSDFKKIKQTVQETQQKQQLLFQEKEMKIQEKNSMSVLHNTLLIDTANIKKQLLITESKIKETEKQFSNKFRRWTRFIYTGSESKEMQELKSKQNNLTIQLDSFTKQKQNIEANITNLEDTISSISSSITALKKKHASALNNFKKIKRGVEIEKQWKTHIEQDFCFLYYQENKNLWIAIQIQQNLQPEEDLIFTCKFLHNNPDYTDRIYPEKILTTIFDTPSYDLMIYQLIQKKLNQNLGQSPLKGHPIPHK
ncbi:TPA: hypothetical protein QC291_005359 [Bacillus cereus]|uniref:hypothetical protein n=1 Tax=Bacillus cereus group TaxID=86661 RepID=UPI0002FE89F4|nr:MULTISPECIES: hypothetical protein [Bacillus cereus group]KMQ12510.1 hypothetical protein TU69_25065 [Bacillus cereus]MBM6769256.1 hypothetical protein [Bacillus cereus]MCU5365115.1 hypothetical protein [Bacillus paranthracis]MDA2192112.1 hypothetical protein [Bacillus cereus group sp. Bc238]MDA2197547.1 hypothetical protein [Bacillus cereus group sp. Bc237]